MICWNLDLDNPEERKFTRGKETITEFKVGKAFKSLKGHSHFVSSVAVSRDGKHAVSGSWDKTLRLWDLSNYSCKQLFSGHTKDVLAVAFSQDNRMILSGGMDKTLRIWNAKGENKYTSQEFNGWVSKLHYVKQGKDSLLAVGSWDNRVRLFDTEYKVARTISELDYGIVALDTDEDGDFLFVGQKDGSVKIWSLAKDGDNEVDTLKQTLEINADLHDLSHESKHFTLLTLATSKGLSVRKIKGNVEIFGRTEWGACLCLTWDDRRNHLYAGFADGYIRVFKFSS